MRPAVKDIAAMLEEIAPPALMEAWDNGGLLAGHPGDPVQGILIALDVTGETVLEAAQLGCSMIVSHHPILFGGTKTLAQTDAQGRLAHALIRQNIAVYSAHTALDRAPGGVADALADNLALASVQSEDYVRIGDWRGGDCLSLLHHVREALQTPTARLYGHPGHPAHRVACVPGSGMDYAPLARRLGADVLVTGDVKHHDALDEVVCGMAIIDAGHLPTERVAIDILFNGLQKRLADIQYKIRIEKSRECPFTG